MYHNLRKNRRAILAAVVAAAGLALTAGSADARPSDPNKCRVEISKQLGKYEATVNKTLNKCELNIVKGKIATTCELDTKTQEKITKAAGKVGASIAKKCCGDDKTCGTGTEDAADLTFEETGWAECPDFYGAGCDTSFTGVFEKGVCAGGSEEGENCSSDPDCPGSTCTIEISLSVPADPSEIADCLVCNADAAVASFMDLTYDAFNDSSADRDLNKCQQEIGKNASKLFGAYNKELGKCAKTRPSQGGVCPEVKSLAKLAKTLAKAEDKILGKKCSGFNATEIGAAASCPSSAERGLGTAATDCSDIAIASTADFIDCLDCVASQTSLNEFAGTCGNGVTDFEVGETCDDGNTLDGDGCPSDCRISDCRIDTKGKTQAIQVSFSVPQGSTVSALEAHVAYPERAVTLPGFGNVTSSVAVDTAADLTVIDTNAGLSIVAVDGNLDPIPAGALFSATFNKCTSLGKNQANLAAAWEGAKVKGAKSDDFVCVVDSAVDGSFVDVEGVTCAVEFLK